jgi:hypothetical protein
MSKPEFTKETLTAKILSGRQAFEEILARVPEKDMEAPVLHDGWSVKDVLGHLGLWESLTVSRFNLLRAGHVPEPVRYLDVLNARVLADLRLVSLEEVCRREQESYQQLLDMIQNASDDELFKPGYFAGANGNSFAAWIPGNTWEHYQEHLPEILVWLDKNS